jgi:hypothetical protein
VNVQSDAPSVPGPIRMPVQSAWHRAMSSGCHHRTELFHCRYRSRKFVGRRCQCPDWWELFRLAIRISPYSNGPWRLGQGQ